MKGNELKRIALAVIEIQVLLEKLEKRVEALEEKVFTKEVWK